MSYDLIQPWTLEGITVKSQNIIKAAAENAREPLETWCERVLLEAAHHELSDRKDLPVTTAREQAAQGSSYDLVMAASLLQPRSPTKAK
nr:hypothetical protein [uncultured Lichenicoccus sp.]